jgi:hypothetical protein
MTSSVNLVVEEKLTVMRSTGLALRAVNSLPK